MSNNLPRRVCRDSVSLVYPMVISSPRMMGRVANSVIVYDARSHIRLALGLQLHRSCYQIEPDCNHDAISPVVASAEVQECPAVQRRGWVVHFWSSQFQSESIR